MKVLGIVPARGGSKGIPGKNTKLLGGRPLIGYTADSIHESTLLADSIVSTDSEEIAKVCTSLGLTVPFLRPSELSQDDTPTLLVIQHAIQALSSVGQLFDAVCILQPTSPFRPKGFVDQAIARYEQAGTDSLISVATVPHQYNPHWVFEINPDQTLRLATGETTIIPRRQDLPNCYYRDGAIYLSSVPVITQGSLYGDSIGFIENNSPISVNLDTPDDWNTAEQVLQQR